MSSVASTITRLALLLVLACPAGLCPIVLVADVVSADDALLLDTMVLDTGGEILGKVSEITEGKQKFWLIETPDGGIVKLKKSQAQRIRAPAAGPEYLQRRAAMPDTVDAHWEMQQWCDENRLPRQREYHLMQIIRLDPEHTGARSRLGYRFRDGVWVHEDHFYQNHGYVKDDRGNHRLPASLQMADFKDARHQDARDWSVTIRSAFRRFNRRNDPQALAEIAAITDPAAVEGLVEALRDETDPRIQKMLVETLGGIPSRSAQNNLVVIAMATDMNDPFGRELRELCVRLLQQPHFSQAEVVSTILPFLRPTPETPNDRVQKAAWLSGQMGDPSAVPALINALVTTHKIQIAGGGGNMTASQGSGGKGLQMGNKPQFRLVQVQNQSALDALRLLTDSRDYGFDKEAWLDWYISTRDIGTSRLGRDR